MRCPLRQPLSLYLNEKLLIFVATPLTGCRDLVISSLNTGKEEKICITGFYKKQIFLPYFMRPNGIVGSLITLRYTLLLILLDLLARKSDSIFSTKFG